MGIYSKKATKQLVKILTKHFNKFIRERDKEEPCISCGRYTTLQAGHFKPGGTVPNLKFDEDNVHGQCLQCNYYKHGNLDAYRVNLIKKIGNEKVERLDMMEAYYKRHGYKWDRFDLIDKIKRYLKLNK